MKIIIKQTSNIKQEFDIYENNNIILKGKCSSISKFLEIFLFIEEDLKIMWTNYDLKTNLKNMLPFKWLFKPKFSKTVSFTDGKLDGLFSLIQTGFLTSYYLIDYNNEMFKCYTINKGDFEYISIYKEDIQIGLIKRKIFNKNYLDEYELYILNNFNCLNYVFILFTLYYDNFNNANRYKFIDGRFNESSWTFSTTNKFYNSKWLIENIENY